MELEARRFARKVLLIHAALLCVLLIVVTVAVRVLYGHARQQALDQASRTQELLSKQTALGIQGYYESVTAVMNLLQPNEGDAATQPAVRNARVARMEALSPTALDVRRRVLESGPLARVVGDIGLATWSSIRDKATSLFVVDPIQDMTVLRIVGVGENAPNPQEIIAVAKPWLESVQARAVSPYVPLATGGVHLVAVPLRGPGDLLMVAAIPVASLDRDVLQYVNRGAATSAMVIDDSGTFVSAPPVGAVGRNIRDFDDPRTRQLAERLSTGQFTGTLVFNNQERMGDITFPPGMSTIQPTEVLGRQWIVVVSSSLNEVDGFVKPIFRDAIIWAAVVMVAAAALTLSTATQLIRGRLRVERMERQVLAKEVTDAREIQLQWLPKDSCMAQGVQIAAVNEPATHISGDFYNWFELDDGRVVVVIGDVTGHGMAAAFLMATVQLLVRNIMPRVADPGRCLQEVNRQLCNQNFNGQFVTLLILTLDPNRCAMQVGSAGHPAPLVGAGEDFTPIALEPQLVLGVDGDAKYSYEKFDLSPGMSVVLYTDGAADVQRPDGERFSTEGLVGSLHGKFESAEALLQTVRHAVDEWRAGRDLGDDLTLVAVQLLPEDAAARTETIVAS